VRAVGAKMRCVSYRLTVVMVCSLCGLLATSNTAFTFVHVQMQMDT
jgi:hypothetical protein